jgi:predicted HAD superfamily Cof-like phosphohydrolase
LSGGTARGKKDLCLFRLHLLLDELVEIFDAIIVNDIEQLADATTDMLYVTFGMQVTYIIPSEECFQEVHRSNMTKDFKDDTRRNYKGRKWSPPDMRQAIAKGRLRQIEEYQNAYNRRFRLSWEDNFGE